METKTYNKLLSLLIVLAIFAFISQDAMGQNLVNKTGAKITNIGTIRFVENNGTLENVGNGATGVQYDGLPAALTPSSGTIQFMAATNTFTGTGELGLADASRINGWVHYAATAGNQNVQGRYYSNLAMVGGAEKEFNAVTVYVDRIYTVIGAGDRDYGTSTFYYDGDVAATEDQTIFPEAAAAGANNIYYKLYFDNSGVKTLAQGASANAENEINLTGDATDVQVLGHLSAVATATINTSAGSVMNINGDASGVWGAALDGIFTTTNGVGTLAGNINIYEDGLFETQGTGLQTITGTMVVGDNPAGTYNLGAPSSGSFTLVAGFAEVGAGGTLRLDNVGGHIVAGPLMTLTMSGTGNFENDVLWGAGVAERANFEFADNSTVVYSGADVIEAPGSSYPYGNLTVSGAQKTIETSTIAFMSGNFNLSGADLLADSDGNLTDGVSREALAMLDHTGTLTYGADLEVVGKLRRYFNTTTNTLVFNNAVTQVTVTGGTAPTYLDLSIWKGQDPAATDFFNTTDIKRKTVWDYSLNGGAHFTSTLRLAYNDAEDPNNTAQDKNSIRFRESDPEAAGANPHKIATGQVVTRNIAYTNTATFAYAEQPGMTSDPAATLTSAYVADGNEIYLRGGPTWYITINHGRWSNPNTWDEGIQPGPYDYTLVRHTVHAGYVRTTDNYTVDERDRLVNDYGKLAATATTEMAAYIWILGDLNYNGTLMLGGIGVGNNTEDKDWGITTTGAAALGTVPALANGNDYAGLTGPGAIAIDAKAALLGGRTDLATTPPNIKTTSDAGAGTLYNGGLLLFNGATFTVRDQGVNYGLITNGGTIIVGTP